jgi:D-alanyl-D-alanine carboxypeptidase (penicillin-binding protein 5/6)
MIKRIAAIAGILLAFSATAVVAIAIWPERAGEGSTETPTVTYAPPTKPSSRLAPAEPKLFTPPPDPRFVLQPAKGPLPVHYTFKHPPLAGILFDVKSGQILWQRHPRLEHQIASLTKMMTALLVAEHDPTHAKVRISNKAAHAQGSATGLLPRGKKVPLQALLQALIMISANDAAVALAEHDGGTVTRFVKEMNAQAQALGLSCTHYSTPNGLRDRNNYSCPIDLAALARADLANPRIAAIARTRYAKPRFPIKGKHLYLSNNHYFLMHGLPGLPQAQVTGLKTGFTDPAGRCYVTTARLGGRQLGVVLLHSPNPILQVPALLRAGFTQLGLAPAAPSKPAAVPPPAD